MKKFIIPIICALIIIYISFNVGTISDFIVKKIGGSPELIISNDNKYTSQESFMFVKPTDSYIPYSSNDLINIIFSTINNGWDTFTFYCPSQYRSCVSDMEKISSDDLTLTHINNFVHPFNSFTNLKTSILETGEITIEVAYLYNKKEIEIIEKEVDKLLPTIIKDKKSDYDKIKAIHDYIINNTKYDVDRNEDGSSTYSSYIAYGPLFEGKATCNGYTDLMAIFLHKLGYKNYKIATTDINVSYDSTGHIWNAVLLDDKWLHIDLTWDDPVTDTGEDYLHHKYFLINNESLKKADSGEVNIEEHNFDKSVYLEFNDEINEIISSSADK